MEYIHRRGGGQHPVLGKFGNQEARSLLRGSVAIRKSILETGSPCSLPVLMVIRTPALPLTSTYAKPTEFVKK
jgi:hypothetical protein